MLENPRLISKFLILELQTFFIQFNVNLNLKLKATSSEER